MYKYKKIISGSLAIATLFSLSGVVNAEENPNNSSVSNIDSSNSSLSNNSLSDNGERVLAFSYKRTEVDSVNKLVYIKDVANPRKGVSSIKVEDGKTYSGDGLFTIFGFTVGVTGTYHVTGSSTFKVSPTRVAAVGLYREYNFKKIKVQQYESGQLLKTYYEVKKTAIGPAYLGVKYY